MKDRILALLIAKFAGVRKDGLAQLAASLSLQVEKEEEATTLIEKLSLEKVNDFVRDWRSNVDKEVSDGTKTHEQNLKKKYDLVEKKEPDPGKDPDPNKKPDSTDIAAIVANAVKAAVEPLQQKLSSFEGQQVSKSRLQILEGKLKDVPETFKAQKLKDFGRMNFESDDAFNEYLTEAEADISAFSQELADKGLAGQPRPVFGAKDQTGVSSAVKEYIDSKGEGSKALTGKEI